MKTLMGDKLQAALNEKKQDINSYIWKFAKTEVNGEKVQKEIKLMDATANQLQTFYDYCQTMLYNNSDRNNPGRYVLKGIIADQITRCNTQLYILYFRERTKDANGKSVSDFTYRNVLMNWLHNNVKDGNYDDVVIGDTSDVDVDFQNIPINMVIDATLDKLGLFNKKHITLNFLTKLGIWFTSDELRELTQRAKEHETDRLSLIKEELGLKNNISIKTNPKGLSYKEFRAMIHLRNRKYSELTKDQLLTLRDKVLFELNIDVDKHIAQWEELASQILRVAKERDITISQCL